MLAGDDIDGDGDGDSHFAVCAVVYDSDVSINYDDPINGSLKGANYGTVAFRVLSVIALDENVDENVSDSSLPKVKIRILDAEVVCAGPLTLFTEVPVPSSSSEPAGLRRTSNALSL